MYPQLTVLVLPWPVEKEKSRRDEELDLALARRIMGAMACRGARRGCARLGEAWLGEA